MKKKIHLASKFKVEVEKLVNGFRVKPEVECKYFGCFGSWMVCYDKDFNEIVNLQFHALGTSHVYVNQSQGWVDVLFLKSWDRGPLAEVEDFEVEYV